MKERLVKYVIAAVAVLAASACTKTELREERRAISYAPVAAKPTKAIIEGTTYPTSESFVVSAYLNGTAAYFENESAGYSSTLNLWETSETEYWPLGGSLTFIAYSPYSPSAASGLSIDASGVTATDYTIQTSAQMQTDICYATATVANCANHPDAVSLVFNHALSQVVFRVKAADYYSSSISLSLLSLSLSGVNSVGDFVYGTWSNLKTPYPYTFLDTSTELTYDPVGNTPKTIVVGSYLLLPQTLETARLNVGYSITQTNLGNPYILDNPPVSIPLGATIAAWEPGKKYIYTINIGIDAINFTATAASWSEQSGGVVVE